MGTTAPNTIPIYPKDIIKWRAKLTNQFIDREVGANQNPVLLGTAGPNGALIHVIDIRYLFNTSSSTARIFTKKVTETNFFLAEELTLPAYTTSSNIEASPKFNFDLPFASSIYTGKGLYLEAGETMYAGLGATLPNGVIVTARGGNY